MKNFYKKNNVLQRIKDIFYFHETAEEYEAKGELLLLRRLQKYHSETDSDKKKNNIFLKYLEKEIQSKRLASRTSFLRYKINSFLLYIKRIKNVN